MDNNEIIVVKQLPVIEEQLQLIKAEVEREVENALRLVCTADTVKSVKEIRAKLNKQFALFEDRRKEVKKAISAPYEQFENVYKDCVSSSYKKADAALKEKIDSVEAELKQNKENDVKLYFEEYDHSKCIDFVAFESARINITLSASMKSLKEQAKEFIDRISDDLTLINTQPYKEEIIVEYKRSLNVSNAISTVVNRHNAIEEEKAKAEATQADTAVKADAIEKVEHAVEEFNPPIEMPLQDEALTIYEVAFRIKGSIEKLKALKNFLIKGDYQYEQF